MQGFRTLNLLVVITFLLSAMSCKQRSQDGCSLGNGLSAVELSGKSLENKKIVFTFEDASGDAVEDISQYLKAQKITAAFFLTGSQIESHSSGVASVLGAGHTIASRGWSGHAGKQEVDPVIDFRRADAAISPKVSANAYFLRSPGPWSAGMAEELNVAGLGKYVGSVGMDVGWRQNDFTDDYVCRLQHKTVLSCRDSYMIAIRDSGRGIVNFRETTSFTKELVAYIVSSLSAEGYSFASLADIPQVKAKMSSVSASSSEGSANCSDYK